MGIPIVGTIGVLLGAYDEGQLSADSAVQAIDALRSAIRWISEELFEYAKKHIKTP
ncbi:MAG: DUF3368 domain-containing protein [Clostridia bacterium]|nr:DUF3368 domain-containing protein [Clostridia bacterium]